MAANLGMGDLPTITNSNYGSTCYIPDTMTTTTAIIGGNTGGYVGSVSATGATQYIPNQRGEDPFKRKLFEKVLAEVAMKQEKKEMAISVNRRIVKVIIVDPDDRVPLDQCILYSGEEKLTDLTDQELFFEIEIKSLLDEHNKTRVKIIDKEIKERTENLEPIKIRDLRMVVIDVAKF